MPRKSPKTPPLLKAKPDLDDAVAGVIVLLAYLGLDAGKDAAKITAKVLLVMKELGAMHQTSRRFELTMSTLAHDPGFRQTMEDLSADRISAQVFCNRIDRHMDMVRAFAASQKAAMAHQILKRAQVRTRKG